MSIKVLVTQKVTQLLLTKVVSLLSSVSAPLPPERVSELVATQIAKYPDLRFAANNDLGLCIDRLADQCEYQDSAGAAFEQGFAKVLSFDTLSASMINEMATEIATGLSRPLYELRTVVPQQMHNLVTAINRNVPATSEHVQPPVVHHFTWGKLAAATARTAAMLFAKDRVVCFRTNVPSTYDTQNILKALPFGAPRTLSDVETMQPALTAALQAAVAEQVSDPVAAEMLSAHLPRTVAVLCTARGFNHWVQSAVQDLRSQNLSAAAVRVTHQIDAMEDLLRMLNVTAMASLADAAAASSATLLGNIDVALANVQLLRAALIYPKEHTLQNRLLLDTDVVQEIVLNVFEAAGGTEAMVGDYIHFMQLNEQKVPSHGISLETVLNGHTKAQQDVLRHTARLRSQQAAKRGKTLQDNLMHTLTVDYQTGLKDGRYNERLSQVHQFQSKRALSLLALKPVEDIALEYLVAMKNNTVSTSLFQAINAELVAVVQANTEVGVVEIATATCSGVVAMLLSALTTDLKPAKAA